MLRGAPAAGDRRGGSLVAGGSAARRPGLSLPPRRALRLALLLAVAAAGPSSFPPRRMLGGEGDTEAVEYKLGIYSVWGSNKPEDGKPPEELKKFIDELKRTSGKKSFRLEGAPRSEKLLEGKQVVVKLPDGYQARWEAVREKGKEKLALRQVLVNPRGEESAVLLRSSPVITSLEKIRRGDDPFLLIVEFEKVSSRN